MSGATNYPGGRGTPAKPRYLRHLEGFASGGRGLQEAFKLFCTMAACALALRSREDEYREAVRGWDRAELEVLQAAFPLLVGEMGANPHQDLLGPAYEALGSPADRSWRGEFFTPPEVSGLAAEIVLASASPSEWPADRPHEMLEPACGSGGMILSCVGAMSRRGIPPARVRVEAWDVSRTSCDMAYTNLTLWGVPARIVWGDSLFGEITREWRNPFWLAPTLGRGGAARGPRSAPSEDPPKLDRPQRKDRGTHEKEAS